MIIEKKYSNDIFDKFYIEVDIKHQLRVPYTLH